MFRLFALLVVLCFLAETSEAAPRARVVVRNRAAVNLNFGLRQRAFVGHSFGGINVGVQQYAVQQFAPVYQQQVLVQQAPIVYQQQAVAVQQFAVPVYQQQFAPAFVPGCASGFCGGSNVGFGLGIGVGRGFGLRIR